MNKEFKESVERVYCKDLEKEVELFRGEFLTPIGRDYYYVCKSCKKKCVYTPDELKNLGGKI